MFRAEFFDIFGMIAFLYIIISSIYLLITKNISTLFTIILLSIGIIGFIIDASIVTKKYLIK